ncbi:D(4) dopamine receptor [Exaiptasia diaphana]|uniref:G-protein coupled receptors family 1 profile domain-containing protein n=1 Tax=Exaiptasia diaphana TaxID=2652724 RepID=A0A913X2N5_EXADI|nr:D(4) dopamine receptor [Exaiptasia diaphana]XP_020897963.1 D(4) dopamine receptor [Exaiptasia diaphana]XP_020897964.1 D(4) dopamine receptor [Exaiptasia diaphana]XP_028514181.1 D(4) dopamine receptor [Exaiptasia diaphana]XP_028514182.1 D(4) dopamine receptor [Exaiptasia diaphana]XP_028514183.1 D(4) dopamine receptor [Exaiptasia diaphana]XP_028514185.1 D(4) dopamine receptor [Exaiptasia diaphana]XP_028514186.1 D(4) dopamine receptor [Exaiptasia diaphana]KXJ15875.1 Beta-2 adrenergic recept
MSSDQAYTDGEAQNASGDVTSQYGGFQAEIDIPLVSIAFLIVVVNGYITLLISRRRDLRTPSNMILASLTVSDGLTGLISVPLLLICLSTASNETCMASAMFIRFISILSAVHILLLTLDRYVFIVHPHKYYDIVRKGRVLLVILAVWLMGILVTVIRLDWAINVYVFDESLDQEKEIDRKERIFNWFCLSAFFIIPLFITITLDAQLLFVLRHQVRKILQNNLIHARQEQSMRTKKRERRAVLVYVVVVVTFIICWLPYFILDLWQQWAKLSAAVVYLIMFIRVVTSLSNPIMYTLSHRTLRRAVVVSLRKTFGHKKHGRPRAMSYQSGQSGQSGLTAQLTKTETTQM